MNSVLATTYSSVYLAVRHIFPEVPISAGAFEPLEIIRPSGTFLDAQYPRPVSGCAAEVSQRIAEAVFAALVEVLPDRVTLRLQEQAEILLLVDTMRNAVETLSCINSREVGTAAIVMAMA